MSTIASISTAPGIGGIGIIRMSGEETFEIIEKMKLFLTEFEIEIIINSNYEIYELYLYDSFNNEIITSGTNSIYIDYLVDDRYSFKAILRGPGNLIDNRTYEMYQTECLFSFTVDTTPPTISGASIYMNGKYIIYEINTSVLEDVMLFITQLKGEKNDD